MKIFSQLLILLLFTRFLYLQLQHKAPLLELLALATFFMLFCIAGTFEELWRWVRGML